MFCPNCGNQIPDDSKFCGKCGTKLMTDAPGKKKTGKTVKIIAIAAAILLLLAAGLGIFVLLGGNSDPWQDQYDLGMRYLSEGNYEEAVLAFLAAIDIDPNRPEAYKRAAKAYIKLDDYEAAREILLEGIEETDDEDLMEELEELEEDMGREPGGNPGGSAWDGDEPTEPEAIVTVYLPTRMEKTIYGDTTTVWVETYAYDSQGNMVERIQYKPDGDLNYVETYTYDDQGRMVGKTYSGYSLTCTYTFFHDAIGTQLLVGKDGVLYDYALDAQGRIIYNKYEGDNYFEYVYASDGLSYVCYECNPDGSIQEYVEYYLDENNNVISTWRYTADNSLLYRTDYIFDERNNHIQTLCYAFCSATHVGTTYTYTYDEYDNLIRVDYKGDYYSSDSTSIYTVEPVEVTESAAARLGQ